jgi:hypothetical protein
MHSAVLFCMHRNHPDPVTSDRSFLLAQSPGAHMASHAR